MYINSVCSISPLGTLSHSQPLPPLIDVKLSPKLCVEPDYKDLIPPMQLRRMSKPVRTGVAAARICLGDVCNIAAINIGTAYGMLQDSENFLQKMIVQEEQMLNPTAFIQSTHNTVSGQIALGIQCNAHNMTYVHRGHSFESALLDAQLIPAHQDDYVLLGAVDECTDTSFAVLKGLGIYDDNVAAGEGAHFLLLSAHRTASSFARIVEMHLFNAHTTQDVSDQVADFLHRHRNDNELDIFVTGNNHKDAHNDIYAAVKATYFAKSEMVNFKDYSGEYPTASGFGLVFSALLVKERGQSIWLLNNFGRQWAIYKVDPV